MNAPENGSGCTCHPVLSPPTPVPGAFGKDGLVAVVWVMVVTLAPDVLTVVTVVVTVTVPVGVVGHVSVDVSSLTITGPLGVCDGLVDVLVTVSPNPVNHGGSDITFAGGSGAGEKLTIPEGSI